MKKLIFAVCVAILITQMGFARAVAPSQEALVNNIKDATSSARIVSWTDYLRGLQDAVEIHSLFDLETVADLHTALMSVDETKFDFAKEELLALKDYQALSNLFKEIYKVEAPKGTLKQYKDFYKRFKNRSPRDYHILPTMAVWKTNSLFSVIPFRFQNDKIDYWSQPLRAAKAYDIMAEIDREYTLKNMLEYLSSNSGRSLVAREEEAPEMINSFFGAWIAQKDKYLPSRQDGRKLLDAAKKSIETF